MTQNDAPPAHDLTERQALALPYLACASSFSKGAELAGISRATITRWIRDENFRAHLQHQRAQVADLAHAELHGLMLKSVLVLAEALDDGDPITRLRAARTTLSVALKADEVRDLRRRLDLLDDAVSLLRRQL